MPHSTTRSLAIKLWPDLRSDREDSFSDGDEVVFAGTCHSIQDAAAGSLPLAEIVLNLQVAPQENLDFLEALLRDSFRIIFMKDTKTVVQLPSAANCSSQGHPAKKQEPCYPTARRVKKALGKSGQSAQVSKDQNHRIALRMPNYWQMVVFDEILYCNSDGGYTTFFLTGNRKILTSTPLRKYEDSLPSSHFIRVHQSFIVNYHFIDRLYKENYLMLTDGTQIPVAVRKKAALVKILIG
ncbi:MAG TPA: LytTR family DNA-binding domain-containing protein [Chryseolinea sp.]